MIDIIKVVLLDTTFKELGETKKRRLKNKKSEIIYLQSYPWIKTLSQEIHRRKNLEHNVKLEQECIAY